MIDWRPELSTGIEDIDRQHRWLIQIIQELNTSNSDEQIGETIEQLIEYVVYHFTSEELLLTDYPGREQHIREHRSFLDGVLDFQRKYYAGQQIQKELYAFLSSWFSDHLERSDMRYRAYFNSLRKRAA